MREWQTTDTAPVGIPVQIGWWADAYDGGLHWKTDVARVWVRIWLIGWVVRSDDYNANKATHWKPLPQPPEAPNEP